MTIVLVLLSIEARLRLGRRRQRQSGDTGEAPIGGVVGALLGLPAFPPAVTCGAAASRFDARRHLLLDEVNAIGTAYLRAGLIAEPDRATEGTLRVSLQPLLERHKSLSGDAP